MPQSLPWPSLHFASIDAPPSFLPAKKYSDVSGLEAKYTDPQTKLNYANADEFKVIRYVDESTGSMKYNLGRQIVKKCYAM